MDACGASASVEGESAFGFVPSEGDRARLIHELSRLVREAQMPEPARCAGLTLIGWLARRMPGEPPHALGVRQARDSERRIRAAAASTTKKDR